MSSLTLYPPYTNPVPTTTTISSSVPIQLQVVNWTSSSLSINTNVNDYLNVQSVRYYYTYIASPTVGSTIPSFRAEFFFQLSNPLNSLDPSQVLTVVFSPSSVITTNYVGTGAYTLQIMLSQGGQSLFSPNYITSSTSGSGNTQWFIPVSNFFTLSTPGVYYRLVIDGMYEDNST